MTTNVSVTDDSFLDTRAAAACLNVSENTLKNWRSQSKGPAYFRNEGMILYSVRDLNNYLDNSRVSTSEQR